MTRRYAVLAAFAVGALVTPTVDIISQLVVAVPLYLFYEAGVYAVGHASHHDA
jgi:sec-independent protein translocase protein TatC